MIVNLVNWLYFCFIGIDMVNLIINLIIDKTLLTEKEVVIGFFGFFL